MFVKTIPEQSGIVSSHAKVLTQASVLRGRGMCNAESERKTPHRNLSEPTRKTGRKVWSTPALVLPLPAMAPTTYSDDLEDSQPLVSPPGPIAPDDIGEDSQPLVLPPGPTSDIMAQIVPATPSDDIGEVKAQIFDDTDVIMGTPDSSDDIGEVTAQSSEVKATAPFKGPHEVEEGNGWELEEDFLKILQRREGDIKNGWNSMGVCTSEMCQRKV